MKIGNRVKIKSIDSFNEKIGVIRDFEEVGSGTNRHENILVRFPEYTVLMPFGRKEIILLSFKEYYEKL